VVGVNNISLHFADRALFDEINFIINKQDRIGLVGRNGAGKSTLLKSLAGIQKLDSGSIAYPNGLTLGYLPQDMDFETGRTVWEETEQSFNKAIELQHRLDEINEQLALRDDYESESYLGLLDELTELNEKLNLLGASSIEAEMEKVLSGLGFNREDFDRQTDEFSGGWRMRIELAKILLQQSDLLLLDEPTNHLDIESIQWLEDFLQSYPGAVLLISHDRAFLDNLTKRTIEITLGRIYDYQAPYSKYLELRKERREQQMAAFENQQKQIKQTEQFIERFRAKATKAVQVQSRIKQLDKIDRIEIEEEDQSAMRFSFPPAPHSGKVALEVNALTKRYGDNTVFSDLDLNVERGEKIALVGKNGEGKSTFSRLLIDEEPSSGEVKHGHLVKIAYYAQNQAETLDPSKTVFETIDEVATGEIRKKIRTLLGSFLFQGEEVDKKVSVLSGGERARVALCKLLLEPVNFLLLDEPTNHLDIQSKDILKDALLRYDGTLLVISHDRDFLRGLADKVVEFSNGNIKEHLGGIDYFLKQKKADDVRTWEQDDKKTKAPQQKSTQKADAPKLDYEDRKKLKKEYKKQKNQLSKLEKEVSQLEEELASFNEILKQADAYTKEENKEVISKWELTNKKLEKSMHLWEKAMEEFEKLEEQVKAID